MADPPGVMESQEYEEVPEEVVGTSYMCGECFLLFPTTEDFNAHECQITEVEGVENVCHENDGEGAATGDLPQPNSCVDTAVVWETGETEAAMEEAVASILGERMKKMAPLRNSSPESEFEQTLVVSGDHPGGHSIEHTSLIDPQMEPVVEHTVEHTDQVDPGMMVEGVEIPSANVYMYDNPVYLNRLMKDNTFGRRVRHDAPYSHRLGPWDNKSSRLLIQLLKENPKAYFILDKECKRTEAWEMIRVKLADAGYQFTVLQIRMRWRELCKKYRNTVNHNDMHNMRRTCQYFDELNDLFGIWDRPATLLLIRQLEANGSKRLGQNGGTRMRHKVWEHIRQVLAAHGYSYTADQVQGRWSTLVTLYQRMVEHNSKPHNEPINIAFKDHIERVFKYVPERNSKWLKIMEKRGKTPKTLKKKWTLPIERLLLKCYHERVYRFNNEHVNNTALWQEIVQQLEDEAGYSTTVEKVRTRFYELTKQFSAMEQHNAQPGTIRRECRHHESLSEIYNIYNYWPHDRSTIKLEKSNVIRMRQVNAQLMWSEDESRALLQLYPQVLVAHLSSGDHQPTEELWLQLAKAYLTTQNDRKQCYEIEEHISLLRRGYRSQNPFPFVSEMQLLEETEMTLGFTPEPLSTDSDQLVPYWSHTAAHLLLDLVMHHRQEAVKNTNLFEMISHDMARHGFRYTGEECRMYYSLLRQLYTNRMRTIKRNKELLKPFPYMEKMAELDTIVSQPKFSETMKNKEIIIAMACSKLEAIEGGDEDSQREFLVNMLTSLKMQIKRSGLVHPPPPIKHLASILIDAVKDHEEGDADIGKLRIVLGPHLSLLESISDKGTAMYYQPVQIRKKGEKLVLKKAMQQKYGSVRWTEGNIRVMLDTLKEWRLLCHDDGELELMLGSGQPVWKEVASRLSNRYKVCPNKCQERFSLMCREYKSVVLFNTRMISGDVPKSVMCEEVLKTILKPFVCHDAEPDVRDQWWENEEGGDWSREETLELIFTVREFWPGWPKIPMDWELVSQVMEAGGYPREAEACQNRFQHLYSSYQAASQFNQTCGMRARRRPPFYFKLKSLFGYKETCESSSLVEPSRGHEEDIEAEEVMAVLVTGLRELKGHSCHSAPRWPLLLSLAQYLDDHYQYSSPTFTPYQVWHLLVQLHHTHRQALLQGAEDSLGDLEGLWEDHPNPLVAYGFHALPVPGYQTIGEWSFDEVNQLIETHVSWELQPRNVHSSGKTVMKAASELLHTQGYNKTPTQCQEQWQYMVATFRHGGYRQFSYQMGLIKLLGHSVPNPHPVDSFVTGKNLQDHQSVNHTSAVDQTKPLTQSPKMRTTATSPLQKNNRLPKCSVKKMKVNGQEMAVLLLIDQENKDMESGENMITVSSMAENVSAFVRINVTPQGMLNKRSVQASTESLVENEQGSHITVKQEPYDEDLLTDSKAPKRSYKGITCRGQKSGRGRGRQKHHKSTTTKTKAVPYDTPDGKVTYVFKYSGDSQDDRVQVKVLSVTEEENAKLVHCHTVEGVVPPRTLKLHYPLNHPLPSDIKHMYVPRMMVHPDLMAAKRIQTDELPSTSKVGEKSDVTPMKIPIRIKEEPLDLPSGEIEEEAESSCVRETKSPGLATSMKSGGKRWDIMKSLARYRQQSRQERTKLLHLLQDNHKHQTALLKQMLTVFQDLQSAL